MKFAIVLLFISFNVISFMHIDESYDIDIFLSDIIEKGFYYLLKEIKCSFQCLRSRSSYRGLSYLLSN